MNRPRRWAAAGWTFAVTLVLVAVLGAPFTGDRLSSHGNALLMQLITGLRFGQWTYRQDRGVPHALAVWLAPIIADVVLALLAGVVAGLAASSAVSSARARLAGLLAGWGLTMVAAAIAGAARVAALNQVTHPGQALSAAIAGAVSAAVWFGLATGWLNGVVLACAVRKAGAAQAPEAGIMGAPAGPTPDEVEAIRIWSPSDPQAQWGATQDMPAGGTPAGQPWPPAANPDGPGSSTVVTE